ncbi:TauD/TfdA family dioxygenase [Pigmentiphaga sp. NML080357]|uniref:TauD/TfdA family dioxygenase n=1 Tax=Pigmentiphaga sp. NML080357 TaxID=2008675 RepID=UPI00130304A0|nr:TauD/TfdA family dioxygenase [Pigmentiphaga sp. NML080357]
MMKERSAADAGRQGWLGSELVHDKSWIYPLSQADIGEIDTALRTFKATGKPLEEMRKEDFPLRALAARAKEYVDEIRNGRGFVVLRGLPVRDYSDEDAGIVFYGLGLYLGQPLRQNPRGDLLGHVFDQGRKFGRQDVRGYQTRAHLPFHTDSCEIVGLLCLRPAKSGGASSISSSVAVYREIEQRHPGYLAALHQGYRYIRREAASTSAAVTEYPVPVYGVQDGVVSCRFIPTQIEAAAEKLGEPITGTAREAFEAVVKLSADAPFRLDMDLQQGDIQLVNNYTVLHSRTEYEDWPEPGRERHMIRLWLGFEEPWPIAPGFARPKGYLMGGSVQLGLDAA